MVSADLPSWFGPRKYGQSAARIVVTDPSASALAMQTATVHFIVLMGSLERTERQVGRRQRWRVSADLRYSGRVRSGFLTAGKPGARQGGGGPLPKAVDSRAMRTTPSSRAGRLAL